MTFMDQTNLRAVKFKVYFIRFCRGDTKSHIQWTGRHLGYTDRASDIHYIFTSEITQPKYHLITSHLVPTVIHHKKLTTQLLTHHKYLGETWTGHLGCARKKVSVCVLFSTTSSGKILGLYPRKTFYKPEFIIFRKKTEELWHHYHFRHKTNFAGHLGCRECTRLNWV